MNNKISAAILFHVVFLILSFLLQFQHKFSNANNNQVLREKNVITVDSFYLYEFKIIDYMDTSVCYVCKYYQIID